MKIRVRIVTEESKQTKNKRKIKNEQLVFDFDKIF